MSSETNWARAETIFNAALEREREGRTAFVASQCEGDAVLQQEVEELLRSRDEIGSFLKSPLFEFRGQRFGAYRAGEEIGRGGMSIVYEGTREDGKISKRVAIKVVLAATDREMHQSETQILAGLEHPGIARLIDAGKTELGFRYLVMELVDGKPCTEAAVGWSGERKLRMFLEICDAVSYAHQMLVVHRDLKPSNVLVDGEGRVKLLDFGIAKMLSADAGREQTRGVAAFTPDYASPEQILGLSVTTATDQYALGVLLCELVGGQAPRVMQGMEVAKMRELAREKEAGPISLDGDLAIVAAKALRRNPQERYESVSEMAADVRRYLAGKPIEARPATFGYVAGKFVERNLLTVVAASLALVGLVAACGYALLQARLAEERFEQVRGFSRSVLFELEEAVRPIEGAERARRLILERSLVYLDALEAEAAEREDVALDLVRGYLKVVELKKTGAVNDRDRPLEKAIRLAQSVAEKNPQSEEGKRLLEAALAARKR